MGILDDAAAYLAGPGRKVAAKHVERLRLAVAPEDLVQETLVVMFRHELAGTEIDDVAPYTARVMRNIAVDLGRGLRRRPEGSADERVWIDAELPDDAALADLAAADAPDAELLARLDLAGLRAALGRRLGSRPLEAAGALAVVALGDLDGEATPASDCPEPKGGATPAEAAAWVGLFYAGRRNCWPVDGDDPPAVRKRRSRYAAAQTAVLHEAAAEQGLHAGGDRV